MRGNLPVSKSRCQSFSPVAASNPNTENVFSAVIAVANTFPLAMIGQPTPSPSFTDHFKFFSSENSVGSFLFDVETPLAFIPRNCGQSSAEAVRHCKMQNAKCKMQMTRRRTDRDDFITSPHCKQIRAVAEKNVLD